MFKILIFIITILVVNKAESKLIVFKDYGNYVCKIGFYIDMTENNNVIYLNHFNKIKTIKNDWGVFDEQSYKLIKSKYKCKKDRK